MQLFNFLSFTQQDLNINLGDAALSSKATELDMPQNQEQHDIQKCPLDVHRVIFSYVTHKDVQNFSFVNRFAHALFWQLGYQCPPNEAELISSLNQSEMNNMRLWRAIFYTQPLLVPAEQMNNADKARKYPQCRQPSFWTATQSGIDALKTLGLDGEYTLFRIKNGEIGIDEAVKNKEELTKSIINALKNYEVHSREVSRLLNPVLVNKILDGVFTLVDVLNADDKLIELMKCEEVQKIFFKSPSMVKKFIELRPYLSNKLAYYKELYNVLKLEMCTSKSDIERLLNSPVIDNHHAIDCIVQQSDAIKEGFLTNRQIIELFEQGEKEVVYGLCSSFYEYLYCGDPINYKYMNARGKLMSDILKYGHTRLLKLYNIGSLKFAKDSFYWFDPSATRQNSDIYFDSPPRAQERLNKKWIIKQIQARKFTIKDVLEFPVSENKEDPLLDPIVKDALKENYFTLEEIASKECEEIHVLIQERINQQPKTQKMCVVQ